MCKFCDELASWKECHDNPERKKSKYIRLHVVHIHERPKREHYFQTV